MQRTVRTLLGGTLVVALMLIAGCASRMPVAYNFVFNQNACVQHSYGEQAALPIHATKLCDSCHDPNDQGSDPVKVINGRNYGPQGGDSRSYVTANHADLGCVDCHKRHDFAPETSAQAKQDPTSASAQLPERAGASRYVPPASSNRRR